MAYVPVNWVDGVTGINAANLNKMEDGIEAHEASITSLLGRVAAEEAQPDVPAVVNGQWIKGVGGAMVYSAIAQADVTGLVAALAAKQETSGKGVANGYAGLGADGKVPSAQLPLLGAKAQQAVAQNIPNNVLTAMTTLATVAYDDTGTIVSGGTMIIPEAGRYILGCYVVFAANATGARSYFLKIDAAGLITMRQQAPTTGSVRLPGETIQQCTAGQVVSVDVVQDSGVALDVTEYKLWIQRIK